MNLVNLLLHIGAAAETAEDAEKLVADLVAKKPVGADAVALLQQIAGLVGDAIFPLPAPLTEQIAEGIINQLIAAVQSLKL